MMGNRAALLVLAALTTMTADACAQALSWPWSASRPLAVSNTPHPSVARITVQERDGVSLGSGTLIDVQGEQGLVITNWHVVRDATGEIEVAFPDGFRSQAKLVKSDPDWDLAALAIWKPSAAPVPLAANAPRPGEVLTIAGYGSGDYRAAAARCTQYVSPGKNLPYEMVEVATEARQGDSGGPMFNERGEIAGVLFGAGGGTTSGSYAGRVQAFLASIAPRDNAAPPAMTTPTEQIASTNPFVNPQGVPHLVAEASAKAPPPSASLAPSTAGAPLTSTAEQPLIPIAPVPAPAPPPAVPVDVPTPRYASHGSNHSYDTLPEFASNVEPALAAADDPDPRFWTRPLPSTAPLAAPVANPAAPSGPAIDAATIQAWLGDTLFDQAKSVLAMVGLLAVGLRWLRSPPKPAAS